VTLITPDKFEKACEFITKAEEIAIDTETYWTSNPENKRIIGVSIYTEVEGKHLSAYFPFRHSWENQENLPMDCLPHLAEKLNGIVHHIFHNAKFDRSRFAVEGLNLTSRFFCTMVGSCMLDENSSMRLTTWLTNVRRTFMKLGNTLSGMKSRLKSWCHTLVGTLVTLGIWQRD
jgi:hypothetical protein